MFFHFFRNKKGRLCQTEAPFFYESVGLLPESYREDLYGLADFLLERRARLDTAYRSSGKLIQEESMSLAKEIDRLFSQKDASPVGRIIRERGLRRIYFLECLDGISLRWVRKRSRDRAHYTQFVFKTTTSPLVLLLVCSGIPEKQALSLATPMAEAIASLTVMENFQAAYADGCVWFPETEMAPETLRDEEIKEGVCKGRLAEYLVEICGRCAGLRFHSAGVVDSLKAVEHEPFMRSQLRAVEWRIRAAEAAIQNGGFPSSLGFSRKVRSKLLSGKT